MKKIFLLLTCLMLTAVVAQAQVGVRAGANWSTVILGEDPPSGVESPWRPGITLGVASNFMLGETFSIAPELNFSQRGFTWEGDIINSEVRQNYLELPVLFRLTFGETLQGYANAGPVVSYWLGGKFDDEDINFSEIEDENRLDLGASLGGGVKLNTESGSFLIDLRYTRGFTDAFKDLSGDEEFKHQLVSVSLIYLIPSARAAY